MLEPYRNCSRVADVPEGVCSGEPVTAWEIVRSFGGTVRIEEKRNSCGSVLRPVVFWLSAAVDLGLGVGRCGVEGAGLSLWSLGSLPRPFSSPTAVELDG
jgi:hypothetical protein